MSDDTECHDECHDECPDDQSEDELSADETKVYVSKPETVLQKKINRMRPCHDQPIWIKQRRRKVLEVGGHQ